MSGIHTGPILSHRGIVIPGSGGSSYSPVTGVAWDHSYWVEGTKFTALGLTNGASVGTWPDETATADMTQATGALKPVFHTTDANFGGKPIVGFTAQYIGTAFTALTQPVEWVVIGRYRAVPSVNEWIFDSPTGGRQILGRLNTSQYSINAGTTVAGGTLDTSAHMWRAIFNGASSSMLSDEVQQLAGNAGANGLGGVRLAADNTGANTGNIDIAFVGIKAGALSAAERTALHSWAQTHYGVA